MKIDVRTCNDCPFLAQSDYRDGVTIYCAFSDITLMTSVHPDDLDYDIENNISDPVVQIPKGCKIGKKLTITIC